MGGKISRNIRLDAEVDISHVITLHLMTAVRELRRVVSR